jgi:hypothetical protein
MVATGPGQPGSPLKAVEHELSGMELILDRPFPRTGDAVTSTQESLPDCEESGIPSRRSHFSINAPKPGKVIARFGVAARVKGQRGRL